MTKKKIVRRQIGVVGVDSGQLLICDPCYINSEWNQGKQEAIKYETNLLKKKEKKHSFSYGGCCNASWGNHQLHYKAGHAGVGVAFPSGYGDGLYPVFGYFNADGRCTRVEVIM